MNNSVPVITEYKYYADIPRNIRLVQLSDLHNASFGKDNSRLLNAVAKTTPDAILITGDLLLKRVEDYSIAADLCHRLSDIAPCFLSLGNHELSYKTRFPESYDRFISGLKKKGICLLDDETTVIYINGKSIEIGGFSAGLEGYARFSKPVIYRNIPVPGTKDTLKILLSHNPELVRSYEMSGWDMIFSGHLHGGVVRIPGFRGLVSPSGRLFPKYSKGYFRIGNGKKLIVSAGLGMHTINIRIFNPPEIVVLNIGKNDRTGIIDE